MKDTAPGTPPVVSNTTPISNLIRIGQLPLLSRIFGAVLIPAQVADELDNGRHVLGDWRRADGSSALETVHPLDGPFLRQLQSQLDEGEAAAIALAVERKAPLLLLDELEGRRVAEYHGIRIVGTLGILLEAKRAGHVSAVGPLVESLEQANFHMSAALKARVLKLAGEA